ALDLSLCGLQRFIISVVEQNGREADDVSLDRNGGEFCIFRKVERAGLAGKQLYHEGEALVRRLVEAVKFLFASATFACLVAASIQKFFESGAEGGIDHLNAEHHVDILGSPEIETGFIEQEV